MSYCPECLTEYAENAAECVDCHVTLQPGVPPQGAREGRPEREPKLVRIRTFGGPTAVMEADLARNILQEQGVVSFIPGETSAEILPGIDLVQLWVREEDAERAAEVLRSYLDVTCDFAPGGEEMDDSPKN